MENEPWQARLKALGIRQIELAQALGMTPFNLSLGMRGKWQSGVPRYLKGLILAFEAMTPEQRAAWMGAMKALTSEPAPPTDQ